MNFDAVHPELLEKIDAVVEVPGKPAGVIADHHIEAVQGSRDGAQQFAQTRPRRRVTRSAIVNEDRIFHDRPSVFGGGPLACIDLPDQVVVVAIGYCIEAGVYRGPDRLGVRLLRVPAGRAGGFTR